MSMPQDDLIDSHLALLGEARSDGGTAVPLRGIGQFLALSRALGQAADDSVPARAHG
jgi:hypothetical protein